MRKTLETAIRELLADYPAETSFNLVAFELFGNAREGFDCNDAWTMARAIPRDEVTEHARARWEVFKVNYLPRARVADLYDISYDPARGLSLEVDCVPFLDIRPVA